MTAEKGMDLAGKLETIHGAVSELSDFMKRNVRPLLSKSESELEKALKDVTAPTGKGLKHVLEFIDDQVSFIANSSRD